MLIYTVVGGFSPLTRCVSVIQASVIIGTETAKFCLKAETL